MTEPNILVERHYIPLSVYMQLYSNNTHASTASIASTASTAPTAPNSYRQTHSNTNTNTNNGPSTSFNNNRNSYLNILNNGQRISNDNDEPVNTIRATRRTTVTIPANTTDPDIENTVTATNTTTTNARAIPGSAAANSRIRIETMASGDENDVNLFNALFAALINPSRLDGVNNNGANQRSNGLTTEQIADNSTVMRYDSNASAANSENQPSSTICSICTLEYEPQQQVRSLDTCDHCFHTGCIDRWLADHNTCPLCRAQVIPASSQRTRTSGARIDLNGID